MLAQEGLRLSAPAPALCLAPAGQFVLMNLDAHAVVVCGGWACRGTVPAAGPCVMRTVAGAASHSVTPRYHGDAAPGRVQQPHGKTPIGAL